MRAVLLIPAIGLLAACDTTSTVPGTEFNTPSYQAQREAVLSGQTVNGDPLIPPSVISSEALSPSSVEASALVAQGDPLTAVQTGGDSAEDIANQTAAALAGTSPSATAQPDVPVAAVAAPLTATAPLSATAPVVANNVSISDEQNFDAVSNRRSIESDAARIEKNKATYEVVTPTTLPQRSSDGQPNIVQYALSSSNPVGAQVYSRAGFNLQAKAQRNCAKFPSPDQAQIEFLASGGPQRDRKGLDPDGDGYACGWDPSPFRRAINN